MPQKYHKQKDMTRAHITDSGHRNTIIGNEIIKNTTDYAIIKS